MIGICDNGVSAAAVCVLPAAVVCCVCVSVCVVCVCVDRKSENGRERANHDEQKCLGLILILQFYTINYLLTII
jgi:hypothetical protein